MRLVTVIQNVAVHHLDSDLLMNNNPIPPRPLFALSRPDRDVSARHPLLVFHYLLFQSVVDGDWVVDAILVNTIVQVLVHELNIAIMIHLIKVKVTDPVRGQVELLFFQHRLPRTSIHLLVLVFFDILASSLV